MQCLAALDAATQLQGSQRVLEVELKLEISETAAAALAASALLPGEPKVEQLHAVYFDTPDHDLAKAGFALRIRRSGDARIQTIKASGVAGAGLFVRPEWEMPVSSDVPSLDHATPVRAMLGDRADEIGPLFEVNVERRTWIVQEGEAEIELVFDSGVVFAGSRQDRVCEVEMELRHGTPAALFALARKLDADVPVHIGVLSKSERGYRLTRCPRSSFKAGKVKLASEMNAAEAFQHIAQACIRQFRLNENALGHDRSVEALHQARVALRRLRSAFSIFKHLLAGDEQAAALREELRWLAAELGEARNLDVLVTRAATGPLHDRLQAARDAAYEQVETAFASPRARWAMLDLVEWLLDGEWLRIDETRNLREQPARVFAEASLDRIRRKVKKDGRNLTAAHDEARHTLRKDAKKLRYASEFFTALFAAKRERKRYKRFISALEILQDELGTLNDLATAPEELRKLGLENDDDAGVLLGTTRKKTLLAAAAKAYDDLCDTKRFWR